MWDCRTGLSNDGEPMRIAEIADDNEIADEVAAWTASWHTRAKVETELVSRQHKARCLGSRRWLVAVGATEIVDPANPGLGLPSERLRGCIRDRD
jgi:hypothetical protein